MDQETIQRGENADRILNDPLVQEVLLGMESMMVQTWKATSVASEREELWYTLKGLERFRSAFEAAIQSGQYERTLTDE
jgi:hypothetical protein